MEKNITAILPTPSLIIMGICAFSILSFFLLIILPNQKAADNLDNKIKAAQLEIERQKTLLPIYREFKNKLKASKQIERIDLPFPEKTKSKSSDIYQIQALLRDTVQNSQLTTEKIDPDVSSIVNESGILKIHLSVIGDFKDFRDFMLQLNEKVPAIKHIEKIQVQSLDVTQRHRLELEIWIAQG